jgi:hypothetical protein
MTLIRGGEERDLAAITAMGQVRASPFRFHLARVGRHEGSPNSFASMRLPSGLTAPSRPLPCDGWISNHDTLRLYWKRR